MKEEEAQKLVTAFNEDEKVTWEEWLDDESGSFVKWLYKNGWLIVGNPACTEGGG